MNRTVGASEWCDVSLHTCVSTVFSFFPLLLCAFVLGRTCTFRTSSEFSEVSSSICLCSSATVPGSAGAGDGLAESVSA